MTATDSPKVQGQKNKKILIIGDLLIDESHFVSVKKISPEAPVPVAYLESFNNITSTPGGAGLGASYAAKNNIPSIFLSAISETSKHFLFYKKIDAISVAKINENIKKIRYIDKESNYHLIRIDTDFAVEKPACSIGNLRTALDRLVEKYEVPVIAVLDYIKGLLTEDIKSFLVEYSKENNIPLYVDARKNQEGYMGATVFKLNSKELSVLMEKNNLQNKSEVCQFLKTEYVIETKGDAGAEIFMPEETSYPVQYSYRSPMQRNHMPDVTGCGDVFDISFVKYFYHDKMNPIEALTKAVNDATQYAYTPVGERL
jgi:D-beta-D-heptose 7-phosphate kinase/D-beta-D-heptose 1-phosphate adenosyltransferase